MDNSTKKSGGVGTHKRERSWDLNELPKSMDPEEEESNEEVSQENDQGNSKNKRKKSINEVSLSCSEFDDKESRENDVDGVNSEQGLSQNPSGGSKGLHGVSVSLGEGGSAFNFPKRPRGSKPLGLANSVDHVGTLNDEVIGSAYKAGGNSELGKSVAVSASKDGGLNPKTAQKVGGSDKKVKEKEDSKSKGGSSSKLKQKVESKSTNRSDRISDSVGLPKSFAHVRAFNASMSGQSGNSVTISAGNDDATNPKSAGKVGVSNSKRKQKDQSKSTTGSDKISKSLKHPKSVDRAGALNGGVIKHNDKAGTRDQLVKLVAASGGSDGAFKSNSSKSKVMQEADSKRKSLLSAVVKQRIDPKLKGVPNAKAKQKSETKSIDDSDKALGPLGLPKSIDRVGAFNGGFMKPKDKVGTSDKFAKLVTTSAGNSGSLNSKSAGKVGALVQKVKEKASQSSNSGMSTKTKENVNLKSASASNQASVPLGLLKSVDRSGAFDVSAIKHKGKASTSDQVVKSIAHPAGNNGSLNSKSAGKVGVSTHKVKGKPAPKSKSCFHSKAKQNADSNSTCLSEPLRLPKSVDHAAAFDGNVIEHKSKGGTTDPLVKSVTFSMGNDGAPKSISAGKSRGSYSEVKHKTCPNSTSECSRANSKLKRKAGGDEIKENRDAKLCSIQHSENEDDTVNNGQTSSKKRRINSRKKGIVIGGDEGKSSKKLEPSVGSSVSDSIFVDFDEDDDDDEYDDEEKLERNAARMLSSRFDPSCTGFSSKRKSSVPQMVNRFSLPVTSSHYSSGQQANSSGAVDSTSADDTKKGLRPKKEDKVKGTPRKRRHFYEILPEDLDPHWCLNRRIKVFWPLDEKWYSGLVIDYQPESKLHHIKYDDRDEEWIDLQEEKFKLLLFPSEVPGRGKSRKVITAKDKVEHKGEALPPQDDASCEGDYLDSEPLVSWLLRSSKRGKSSETSDDDLVDRMVVNHLRGVNFVNHVLYVRNKKHKGKRSGSAHGRSSVSKPKKVDRGGQLRINLMRAESNEFNFCISLPVLHDSGFSLRTMDFWLFRNMLITQHWVMSTASPTVNLEMLFIDSHLGVRFLLYEGCMYQALPFIFSILTMFCQADESQNGDMQSPVISVRLRLSSVDDLRKHHTIELHSFVRLQSLKWVCPDFELVQHCVLIKQLDIKECTYDNIKTLECASLTQCKPHADLELPNMVLNKKFVPRILPAGVCDKALKTRSSQSAEMRGKVPQFSLSFSAAPTFLLTRHLQLLFENSSDMRILNHPDALSSPENIENDSQPITECIPSETTLASVQDSIGEHEIGTLETEVPLVSNVVEKIDSSENLTGSNSVSSPCKYLSPTSPDGFSNRPKRPRTQVRYRLPSEGYDFSTKRKTRNQSALPRKQIRRASLKRKSNGARRTQKNSELVACGANVLITNKDKGWRECGAVIVLEVADHNEWRLAIKLCGVTKYSYEVKEMLQPGSTNRFSHAILWKGGKDWLLEFAERSQWNLFKEMYEDCYNRNRRAASVKSIAIPGVQLIDESDYYGTKVPFVRHPRKYYRQFQTDSERAMDPSRILYDMDSDDEQWLMENNKCIDENNPEEISEEFFEKTMDMFEKTSYAQRRDKFTDTEVQELVNGVGSAEAAKVIYEHWQEKRGKKGMPLIRHLQPPLWELYQKQLKEWEHTVNTQERVPTAEKPPMFAFCQKPRGLDVPNKLSKQRSHRKFSVSGNFHAASRDPDSRVSHGRRPNRRTSGDVSPSIQAPMRILSPGDENCSMSADLSTSNRNSKAHMNKSMKLGSPSRTKRTRDEVQADLSSQGPRGFEGPERSGVEQSNGENVHEFWVLDAAAKADHATKRAKHKKEVAQKLYEKADIMTIRAARYVILSETSMQNAAASD